MTDPGRSRFDAQVALATSQTRADAAVPPSPRWRKAAGAMLGLVKPVARPILLRLRSYLNEPLRQEMLELHEHTSQESRLHLEQLQRHIDAGRDEMRVMYTSLLDQINVGQLQAAQANALEREAGAALQDEVRALHGQLEGTLASSAQRTADLHASLAAGLDGWRAEQTLAAQLAGAQLARVENYSYASARRVALPCGGTDMLVKTEAGYIMCANTDLSVLSTLVETGDLERGTRLLIQSLLRPGDVFVDVGANIGMHTLAGGHAMAAQGTIIAFEPFEPTRRLLEKSLWMNGLGPITRLHGCAVSDHAGSHPLFLGQSSGHHSLFAHGGEDVPAQGQVEVRTVRLDDVVEAGLRVTLLKIDAEGAELAVLMGAAATLRNSPDIALIVEFGPSHLRATGQDGAAWLAAFEAFGFEHRAIDPASGALARCTLAGLEAEESTNLFFARPGSAAWTHVKETA